MNGRFPFDHNARRPQLNGAAAADVRAALGLTSNVLDDTAAYYTNLQQQHHHQQQQQQNQQQHQQLHSLRALQDQLYDQRLRQEELRVIQDRLVVQHQQQQQQQQQGHHHHHHHHHAPSHNDYVPDSLQHQYAQSFQQLLLAEQLQRQQQQVQRQQHATAVVQQQQQQQRNAAALHVGFTPQGLLAAAAAAAAPSSSNNNNPLAAAAAQGMNGGPPPTAAYRAAYEQQLLRQQLLQQQQQHRDVIINHHPAAQQSSPPPMMQQQRGADMIASAVVNQQHQHHHHQQQIQHQTAIQQNVAVLGALGANTTIKADAAAAFEAAVGTTSPATAMATVLALTNANSVDHHQQQQQPSSFTNSNGATSTPAKRKAGTSLHKNGNSNSNKKKPGRKPKTKTLGRSMSLSDPDSPQAPPTPMHQQYLSPVSTKNVSVPNSSSAAMVVDDNSKNNIDGQEQRQQHALGVLAGAAGLVTDHDGIMSSMGNLIAASQEVDGVDTIAHDLVAAFGHVQPEELLDDDDNSAADGAPQQLSEEDFPTSVTTPFFRSEVPTWPRTSKYYFDDSNASSSSTLGVSGRRSSDRQSDPSQPPRKASANKNDANNRSTPTSKATPGTTGNLSVDPWWPADAAIKRERKNAGEHVDEDDFPADPASLAPFRANETKIRTQLESQIEPGVLEKLPHCRIHLINSRSKKNNAFPELAFCVQVAEWYPNDPMLHCSSCGTWRHAKCGGRSKPSTGAADRDQRLSNLCDLCYAEGPYLSEHPIGADRIERQRMEHVRHGLATTAVIRHFSNSKSGGTYKWPLGSVSTAHIGGHIRSVHLRHEKAEKQWSDMLNRLSRGLGFRAKDRVKNRQKEFERLLSSVEDAEAYTDRHNMYIFLARDTSKDRPAGFEDEDRNMFDPADDEDLTEIPASLYNNNNNNFIINNGNHRTAKCERQGCCQLQRFDSRFCSDACGVACLELDLLLTLEDAGEVHPSFLRTVV